ncbi:MAG: type IV toxin-antitoxin system AbiEi family antitoxin domain-containing protein [Bacteriovoracia bacterium]
MNSSAKFKTLKRIRREVFTAKDAIQLGLSYYDLDQFVKEGLISKIERGVFVKRQSITNQHEHYAIALAQLGEPSALCLWSALVIHDLTEEAPSQIWVYVPYEKTTRLQIKTVRKRNPHWDVGIETINGIRVTSIERTLVDMLLDRKHFSEIQAFKITMDAIRARKTNFKKLYEVAKKMQVEERLKRDLILLEETYV